ncbi:hypothetical protein CK203_086700 [Vitis vinifera]|uniref:Uncharacterized protein n=1 Tax=Vitis vinifera TaxID=29760 RepID=A0A438EEJ6_VITVI|nr:hypothetical protein CK203_086700 [Vitis vinifera]
MHLSCLCYQIVLNFLEGRKENRVWYNGSYYALGVSLLITHVCISSYILNIVMRDKPTHQRNVLSCLVDFGRHFRFPDAEIARNALQEKDIEPLVP